jgi:hypothetical protein
VLVLSGGGAERQAGSARMGRQLECASEGLAESQTAHFPPTAVPASSVTLADFRSPCPKWSLSVSLVTR